MKELGCQKGNVLWKLEKENLETFCAINKIKKSGKSVNLKREKMSPVANGEQGVSGNQILL